MKDHAFRLIGGAMLLGSVLLAGSSFAQEKSESWFEVEHLNRGLGPTPEFIARGTPRDTVSSFLIATRRADYAAAAHALNLSRLESEAQADRGPRLARALAEVIRQQIVVDWDDLPERPDGLSPDLPKDHPFAGEVRRSIVLAEFTTSVRPVTIRVSRVKPAGKDAVWVFSSQTVEDIPRLYAAFGPGWLDRQLPAEWTATFGGVQLWEIFALPVALLLAGGLYYVLRKTIGIASRRSSVTWINRASEEMKGPLALGLSASALQYATGSIITFSGAITTVLSPLLAALIIIALTLAALNVIDATLEVVTDRYVNRIDSSQESERRHLYTNIYALRRFVLLAAVLVSAVLVIYELDLLGSFGLSLLASAGVATVILGIAGQAILGNILASLQLAIAKPIRIGDVVNYEGRWAYIESIYYTYVVLRCWDEQRLIVPVRHLVSQPFENWTMLDARSTRSFAMQLDLSAEPEVLRGVFEEIVRHDERAIIDEMLLVVVEEYTGTMQTVRFYATAGSPSDAWMMHAALSEKMGRWIRENRPDWWPRYRVDPSGQSMDGEGPHEGKDRSHA